METLKCKMCGASLQIHEGDTIAECEYCGSQQTVPNVKDKHKLAAFEKANAARAACDFASALKQYETILADDPTDPEANWGVCLCRYGIEYVEDPRTSSRVPTCHRTQRKSILKDANYLLAVKNSDPSAQELYTKEAAYIDKVQQSILKISASEAPFDIFISYKETDAFGMRTEDSVLAEQLYEKLTDKGYKVFFSRITLEDKLGSAYEPYIFAALDSAPLMLVIGTKPEYFNAVWVKNEWSRFLAMKDDGANKTLVPCFLNMTAYDMPVEFRSFQGQDMSKLGWDLDVVRGVKKILDSTGRGKFSTETAASVSQQVNLPIGQPIPILSIKAIGAANTTEYWPKGNYSAIINRDATPCVAFHINIPKVTAAGTLVLTMKVLDEMGNVNHTSDVKIAVKPGNDRLSQIYILRGGDGTTITEGNYRVEFAINGGLPAGYNFRVVSNANPGMGSVSPMINGMMQQTTTQRTATLPNGYQTTTTSTMYQNSGQQGMQQQNQMQLIQQAMEKQRQADLAAQQAEANRVRRRKNYLWLNFFLGMFGAHRFYAHKYKSAVAMLLITMLGSSAGLSVISWIWAVIDWIRVASNKKAVV